MPPTLDLVCLAHLSWDFVYQRPQHLMSRCARVRRVFYIEPPVFDAPAPHMEVSARQDGLSVVTPHLPPALGSTPIVGALGEPAIADTLRLLIDGLLVEHDIAEYIAWYYTPMAINPMRQVRPPAAVTIYDCMDDLAAFADGPEDMPALEQELLTRADLVFTGGYSLYEAKRTAHARVYAFPSGVDAAHFDRARHGLPEPADQAEIPHPRLGFYGVLDERLDRDLIAGVADARPDWNQVLVGPVATQKFDPALLPRRPNIHYLGMKRYDELPAYLAGWDVATLPFARNQATRSISPTKTPEYLVGGKPVVSTLIHDVIHPYGDLGLAHIADTPTDFIVAVEQALDEDVPTRLRAADLFLAGMSWDQTWAEMDQLMEDMMTARLAEAATREDASVGGAVLSGVQRSRSRPHSSSD